MSEMRALSAAFELLSKPLIGGTAVGQSACNCAAEPIWPHQISHSETWPVNRLTLYRRVNLTLNFGGAQATFSNESIGILSQFIASDNEESQYFL